MKKLFLLPLLLFFIIITYSFSNKSYNITMPSLLFKENSAEFAIDTTDGKTEPGDVQALVRMMDKNPTTIVELDGHADLKEKQTMELSLLRAEVVVKKMIAEGVVKERLKVKGFGSSQPIYEAKQIASAKPKDRERMHLRNRRVSFRILSFDYRQK
jgi:outer membrane protein OmpA-like peptidoglycan-associated protein